MRSLVIWIEIHVLVEMHETTPLIPYSGKFSSVFNFVIFVIKNFKTKLFAHENIMMSVGVNCVLRILRDN